MVSALKKNGSRPRSWPQNTDTRRPGLKSAAGRGILPATSQVALYCSREATLRPTSKNTAKRNRLSGEKEKKKVNPKKLLDKPLVLNYWLTQEGRSTV